MPLKSVSTAHSVMPESVSVLSKIAERMLKPHLPAVNTAGITGRSIMMINKKGISKTGRDESGRMTLATLYSHKSGIELEHVEAALRAVRERGWMPMAETFLCMHEYLVVNGHATDKNAPRLKDGNILIFEE